MLCRNEVTIFKLFILRLIFDNVFLSITMKISINKINKEKKIIISKNLFNFVGKLIEYLFKLMYYIINSDRKVL